MYYLAGVGTATLFNGDQLFATGNTLLDSSITIGSSTEELRAGLGNALYGIYVHSTSFNAKLTDAMFNLEYLAANVGGELERGGNAFNDVQLVADETGKVTLPSIAVPIRDGSLPAAYVVRADASDKGKRTRVVVSEDNTLTGLDAGATYCVRYLYTSASARKLTIYSDFIPGVFDLYLTANLFSSDNTKANSANASSKVGTVTIHIPRFMLNGQQELSMTATGIANTALEGFALASDVTGCDNRGVYAEITELILGTSWYSDASGLIIEDSYVEEKVADYKPSTPVVYAWYASGSPKLLSNAILTSQESDKPADEKTKLVFSITPGTTGLSINAETGAISGTPAAGTATIKVVGQLASGTAIPGMDASATIVLTA